MKNLHLFIFIFTILIFNSIQAQYDDEPILYFQMEPLDDSLFITIQESLFIDPPDPKAEIIVDLRDTKNSTIQIMRKLYPLIVLSEELRARIQTYPFKLNLEDNITYTSVFTDVASKIRLNKLVSPPTKMQINSNSCYINPYIQLFGGERFGLPLKKDIGLSLGLGTPYSGPMETDIVDANFHILGFRVGVFGVIPAFTELKETNNHNNLYGAEGIQFGYVIPFGNFLEISYNEVTTDIEDNVVARHMRDTVSEYGYRPKLMKGSYFNYELRYPLRILGATRSKFYVAKFLNEWHIGFSGRELSLAGSTFDLRIDTMPVSDVRNPQYLIDILIQRVMESWGFSAFSLGPSALFSKNENGNFGVISLFFNMRLKVGTSF